MDKNILRNSYDKSASIYNRNFRDLQYEKYRAMVDFSPGMVETAQASGANAIVGDIGNLPFEDSFFDCLFSFTVLGITDQPLQPVLEEASRVLRTQGVFLLTVLEQHYNQSLVRSLQETGFHIGKELSCGQDRGIILSLTAPK